MPEIDREQLGKLVRQTWVQWASEQRRPKRSWLVGWDSLDAGKREVDMRIGEAVANHMVARIMGDLPKLRAERDELDRRVNDLRAFEREYRTRLYLHHQGAIDELSGKEVSRGG